MCGLESQRPVAWWLSQLYCLKHFMVTAPLLLCTQNTKRWMLRIYANLCSFYAVKLGVDRDYSALFWYFSYQLRRKSTGVRLVSRLKNRPK